MAWAPVAVACVSLALAPPLAARVHDVRPGGAGAALAAAAAGDTIRLLAGVHRGPLSVERPLVMIGAPGAVVVGGAGSVLSVRSGGVRIEDLELRASGRDAQNVDAGIRILGGEGTVIERVRLHDVLYGITAERATGLQIRDCVLQGRVRPLQEDGSGNGIHLWSCEQTTLERDTVRGFQDAVYLSFTNGTHIERSLFEANGRYGLHTMYAQNGRLSANRFTRNVAGCALMFSNHLVLEHNDFVKNRGPRTYGLLLRDCSDGRFAGNRIAENTIGVFMDGSNRNRFEDNLVEDNGWGLLLFSSCARNTFARNDFVNDDYPVALDMRRTSNRFDDGREGNYWSAHAAFDLDGDSVSDVPYSPVSAFAFLSKQYPDLTLLANSPAVAALSVAERVFPALRPSEAVDRFPRTRPLGSHARPRGTDGGRERGGRSLAAAAAFAALTTLGALGLAAGRAGA